MYDIHVVTSQYFEHPLFRSSINPNNHSSGYSCLVLITGLPHWQCPYPCLLCPVLCPWPFPNLCIQRRTRVMFRARICRLVALSVPKFVSLSLSVTLSVFLTVFVTISVAASVIVSVSVIYNYETIRSLAMSVFFAVCVYPSTCHCLLPWPWPWSCLCPCPFVSVAFVVSVTVSGSMFLLMAVSVSSCRCPWFCQYSSPCPLCFLCVRRHISVFVGVQGRLRVSGRFLVLKLSGRGHGHWHGHGIRYCNLQLKQKNLSV